MSHAPYGGSSVPAGEEQHVRIWQSPRATIARFRRDSLLRNSLFIMATTVVNSALGYLFWLLAARLFPPQIVGLTAGLIAASTILVLLASLGVGGTLIQSLPEARGPAAAVGSSPPSDVQRRVLERRFRGREVIHERAGLRSARWSRTFWGGMAIAVVIAGALTAATLVLLPILADQLRVLSNAWYATVFVIGTMATTAGAILDYAFIADRSAANMFVRNSAVAVGKVLLILILTVVAGANALTMLGAWAFAAVAGLGLGVGLLLRRMSHLRLPRPSAVVHSASAVVHSARELRTQFAGQQLIGMGGALLPYLLSVLVTVRLSSSDNAYFYTTWMMAGIFLIIAPAVSLSLFAEGANDPHDLRLKARSALTIIGVILVPGAVAVLATGGILLSAFGTAYEQHAVGLLQLVLLASFPDAITNVYVAVLRVRGRLVAAAGLNLGMGVGTVGLSWVLLPVVGITAIGWSFLAMQLGGCLFVILDLIRRSNAASAVESAKQTETI